MDLTCTGTKLIKETVYNIINLKLGNKLAIKKNT